MAFSVSRSRPFRSLGLYKSSGKHAAPKGSVVAPRKASDGTDEAVASEQTSAHHPAHAATSPRLSNASAATDRSGRKSDAAEKRAA
jgi:hypothetical protein